MKRIDELRMKLLELWSAPRNCFDKEAFAAIHIKLKKLLSLGIRGDPKLSKYIERKEGWKYVMDRRKGRPIKARKIK